MKARIKNLVLIAVLVTCLGLIQTGRATAQTFQLLHSFTNGGDGANPYCGLVLSGSTLYGVAAGVGGSGYGPIFAVNTDGTEFTNLYILVNGGNGPEGGLL